MTYHVPARATKASELAEQINAITCADEANDLALRRIEKEAQALMAADPAGAHTALGALAVLQGSIDDVRRHHRIAFGAVRTLCGGLPQLLGLPDKPWGDDRGIRDRPGGGPACSGRWGRIAHLILVALGSAHFREARDHCDRWNTLFPGDPSPYEAPAKALAGASNEECSRGVGAESPAHRARCSACGKSRPACSKNRPGGRQRTRFVPLQAPHSVVARSCGRSQ